MGKTRKGNYLYSFKQQILPAWQPMPTFTSAIIFFAGFALLFLVLGFVLLSASDEIHELSIEYTDCQNSNCFYNFNLEKNLTTNSYLYYEMENFYQNYRQYVKSRSPDQLAGESVSFTDIEDCKPIYRMKNLGRNSSVNGTFIGPDEMASPCGLIAKSFFNVKVFIIQGHLFNFF